MDSHEQDNFAQHDQIERAAKIRELNDLLRVERAGGQLFVTHGICSLGQRFVPSMIKAVIEFDQFSADNDPYSEHDFGALEVLGQRIFFKIGVPPLYPALFEDGGGPTEDDHAWHMFDGFREESEMAEDAVVWGEASVLLAAFRAAKGNWRLELSPNFNW